VVTALAGAAANPPLARYREPSSTRLQPVVRAKYLQQSTVGVGEQAGISQKHWHAMAVWVE
jgi:hypothetical protein